MDQQQERTDSEPLPGGAYYYPTTGDYAASDHGAAVDYRASRHYNSPASDDAAPARRYHYYVAKHVNRTPTSGEYYGSVLLNPCNDFDCAQDHLNVYPDDEFAADGAAQFDAGYNLALRTIRPLPQRAPRYRD